MLERGDLRRRQGTMVDAEIVDLTPKIWVARILRATDPVARGSSQLKGGQLDRVIRPDGDMIDVERTNGASQCHSYVNPT